MKKIMLAATAALALGTPAFAQETVRIATEGAYAPWNFINDAGQPDGYEIDLGSAICEKAELSCEFVVNDWDSIIPNLLAGNYDVIMAGMNITEERLQTIAFSDEYFPPDPSRYVALAGTEIDFDNLSGVRIGVQGGTIQAGHAEAELAANNTVVSFTTADQAVADLAAGNVDVIFADGAYVDPIVTASSGSIEYVGPDVLIGEGMAAGLRKEDTDLKAKLDEALAALKADGTVDKLIAARFEGRGPYYAQ
ncbi:transporter substrate-binding domain-containing protein [Devosia aurantiaca]|uniref:Transporter substrate-binding domain-containing protein n=1 Tax=Devosia aurantiaca TaxID=2714858 RepID=A0A6M1SEP2_9HYPH|nr:transporter substrate-binding domain-containing protein [Devosia aurantiaca]NGP18329.1 transporter substrate-binding domain-containing protein [Devosia aurantiaca]